jgi:hypothetical protein
MRRRPSAKVSAVLRLLLPGIHWARPENVRLIAAALGDRVGELLATAGPEALRQVAAIVKTHSAGVLASMAGLASKAERLECIADIRDACQPAPSADREG